MRRQELLQTSLYPLVEFGAARAHQPPGGRVPAVNICNHAGHELGDGLRIRSVQFTRFESNTAFWKYQDGYGVKLGVFDFSENAQYISREKRKVDVNYLMEHKDSEWLCYFCSHCHVLMSAHELKGGI